MTANLAVALTALALTGNAPRGKLLLLPDLMKHMEASPIAYSIKTLESLHDVAPDAFGGLLYPQRVRPVELPQVRVEGGKRVIAPAPCDAAQPRLHQAENIFQTKHYDAAAALYDEAIAQSPKCYLALAYRGDASFFAGDVKTALGFYQRALAMNPDDGSIYVFRSNAYARLGRKPEALEDLRTSLALRPHVKTVLDVARKLEGSGAITVRDVPFVPEGFARKEGDGYAVYTDATRPAWLGYAACKALWMAEPEHRAQVAGTSQAGFSIAEERECIAALLVAYDSLRQKGSQPEEPQLEYLEGILKAGDLDAWIVYELASRVDPQVVLRQPPELRKRIVDFVRKHVLVDAK
jgi:tetratricopeptide (TPR) repeat protein